MRLLGCVVRFVETASWKLSRPRVDLNSPLQQFVLLHLNVGDHHVTVSGCDTSKPNNLDYTQCVLYKSSMYLSSSERLERPTSTELPEGILEGLLVYKIM